MRTLAILVTPLASLCFTLPAQDPAARALDFEAAAASTPTAKLSVSAIAV